MIRVKSKKKKGRRVGTKKYITVHFATLMDVRLLKNPEVKLTSLKYKDRDVLRDDVVKDDSDSSAVFSERGSSASQVLTTKVLDVISKVSGYEGQPSDVISVYPQVKMDDVPISR